jgi:ATP-dependent DNA helicase PIF1
VERPILSARNDDVDELNHRILCDFPGEEKVYLSADSIKEDTADPDTVLMYPTEYLNMITASGLRLHKLVLKIGSPVMVLHNLNPLEGVCNGSRGIITQMTHRVLELQLLGGDHDGQLVFLPRIKCYPTIAELPYQLCRLQFAVQNAFSTSVNKAQGQSLSHPNSPRVATLE